MTYLDLLRWPCSGAIIGALFVGACAGFLVCAVFSVVDRDDV